MNKQALLIVGILLAILGIAFFIERGFFASTFLGARVLGNMGWRDGDASKIKTIAVVGGLSFLAGVVMTITGALKKDKKDVGQ